jgi:tetratricopeptide (TPR) repeat protein
MLAIVGGAWLWLAAENMRLQEESRRLQAELRQQQEASVYRERVRLASTNDEQLALAELAAGRLESALKILKAAVARLAKETGFADLRARLEAIRDRVSRLVEFYQRSTEGELAVAEKFRSPEGDQEAREKFRAALTQLGVFQHREWWNHLPDADLSARQRERLRQDAYRDLHYLAALECKGGVPEFHGGPGGKAALERALKTAKILQRYRPSYSAGLLEKFCLFRLGRMTDLLQPLAAGQPTDAVDAHFAGLIHLWISGDGSDSISQAVRLGGGLFGVDTKTPLATAERYLRQAASLDPQHYWTNYWLGAALRYAGWAEEAEIALNNCVALRPTYSVGYAERDYALRQQYQQAADAALKKAIHARRLNGLTQALQHNPRAVWGFHLRGHAHRDNQDYDAAIADFNQIIKLAPGDAEAYFSIGLNRQDKRDLKGASAAYRQAIKLDRKQKGSHINLGNILWQQGNLQGAIAEYRRALQIDTNYALAHTNLGDALRAKGDFPGAIAACRKAIKLRPADARTRYILGLSLHGSRDLEGAITAYRQAIKLAPKYAAAHHNLGNALRDKGDLEGAVAEYKIAIELNPKDATAYFNLGRALRAKGDLKGAAAADRKASEIKNQR